MPDSAALHLHDAVTLAAWIKPTLADFDGQTHGIISKPTTGTGWALRMEGNGLNFGFNNGPGGVNCSIGNSSQTRLTIYIDLTTGLPFREPADSKAVLLNGMALHRCSTAHDPHTLEYLLGIRKVFFRPRL